MSEAKPRDGSSSNKTALLVITRTKLTNRYVSFFTPSFVKIRRPVVVYKKKEITKNMEIDGITIESFIPNLSMKSTKKNQIIHFTSRS